MNLSTASYIELLSFEWIADTIVQLVAPNRTAGSPTTLFVF